MNEGLYSVESEKSLLGALITDNSALERVADFLQPGHFAIAEHGIIFETCRNLIDNNKVADFVTLAHIFDNNKDLAAIGGSEYLAELMASAVTIINSGEYGKIIHDLHIKRELVHIGQTTAEMAGSEADVQDVIDGLERELTALTDDKGHEIGTPESQMDKTLADLEAAYKGEHPPGLETGLIDLDRRLGRLRPSGLYIIAGRPAMGKSILGLNIAERVASEEPSMLFSLEMPAEEIHQRRICNKTNIDFSRLRNGEVSSEEMKRVIEIGHRLQAKPLFVDDTGAIGVEYIKRHARRQKRKTGLGLVVVDYIQLMSGERSRNSNREQEISSITRGLKALAKELQCPVVALSQLSRAVESREDKTPRLSDLRESGAIEQDADAVMFLYRWEYYLEQSKPVQRDGETPEKFDERCTSHSGLLIEAKGLADVIVAKNRQGSTGSTPVHFSGANMKFANLARTM